MSASRVAASRTATLFLVLSAFLGQPAIAAVPHTKTLSFDGQNDVATIAHRASLSSSNQVTVEAWIKPLTIATASNQDRVVSKGNNYELTISTGDTGCAAGTRGHVQWRATIGGVDARICGGQLNPGTWHHIAGTYNGATFALYVDGARVASTIRSGGMSVNSIAMTLGNKSTLDRPLDGDLDEVRIWRRALSQSELQMGSEVELSGSEPDLVGYYRLDETSGQVVADSTSNANHGVLGANASADSSDPTRTQASANMPPEVSAGSDQTISWPSNSVQLTGSAQDDGLPDGTLSTTWTRVSGPSTVSFSHANSLQTLATFSAAGTYVLRLTAGDGELNGSDTLEVRVTTQQVIATLEIHPRFVTMSPGQSYTFWATAKDGAGNDVNVTPTWAGSGGTITAQGRYTAGTQLGTYTVRATAGGISRIANVDIASSIVWPSTTWPTATPSSMGMNATLLAQARDYALTGGGSGMILRSGRVVLSWGNAATRFDLKSSTKSIGATALGLALQDGTLMLDDPAQMHLPVLGTPPASNVNTGWLDDIRVLHLATQTAGFDKPGGYTSLLFEPGTRWSYTDGGANWLADLLTSVFNADLNAVLFTRAFTRMGITSADFTWRSNAYREDALNGVKRREFGAGISANANAMSRIGYLYLRRGVWAGERLLPDPFIEQVQKPVQSVAGVPMRDPTNFPQASSHYGLLWWTNADGTLPNVPRDAFWAWGLGDSLIVVIPSIDVVVVRAGNGWRTGWNANYSYLDPFLTPISQAVNAKRSVPNVIGQTESAAMTNIDAARLVVSEIVRQRSSSVARGRVIQQTPAAGTQVPRNTGVQFVVSSGP
jgi:CubicO group peptidase (beta-lactamase class C family)